VTEKKKTAPKLSALTQTASQRKKLVIPCLRGALGSWVTYTCLMRLSDIASLVHFAKELQTSKKLSQMIQRKLEFERADEIADYLLTNEERFFNSLVLGIYDGEPQWHTIQRLQPQSEEAKHLTMPDYAQECLGFLTLTTQEQLFALDGQHRLAGIKKALESHTRIGEEQLTVIIVVHRPTPEGIKKSRRLFTTLNKKAKIVSKDSIIALDEDDISASITRRLVEETDFLNEGIISFSVGPLRDSTSVTTLGSIYDCTQLLIANFLNCNISQIERTRIDRPEEVWQRVREFYRLTFSSVEALSCLTKSNNEEQIKKYRNSDNGGHLLFRPIGWEIYTMAVISLLNRGVSLKNAIGLVTKKDLTLTGPIIKDKVWSMISKRIIDPPAKARESIIFDLTS
jgi:DNA sulfur modification protein DndB